MIYTVFHISLLIPHFHLPAVFLLPVFTPHNSAYAMLIHWYIKLLIFRKILYHNRLSAFRCQINLILQSPFPVGSYCHPIHISRYFSPRQLICRPLMIMHACNFGTLISASSAVALNHQPCARNLSATLIPLSLFPSTQNRKITASSNTLKYPIGTPRL